MWHSGLLGAWLKLRPQKSGVAVLNYHDIPAATFADHLRALTKNYRIITLDACRACLNGQSEIPANSVAITFDDAYQSFHDDIFPVLRHFNVPATMFVPTASIDEQDILWFNRVKALIFGTVGDSLTVGNDTLSLKGDRSWSYHQTIRQLNDLPIPKRNNLLETMFAEGTFSGCILNRYRPMTWNQMREMSEWVTFGAHTVTHPNLALLDSSEIDEEITTSRKRIEEELSYPVNHFAYPFGQPSNINDRVIQAVRRSPYAGAWTTVRGLCREDHHPYQMPRIDCDGIANGRMLATRLSGLWVCLST